MNEHTVAREVVTTTSGKTYAVSTVKLLSDHGFNGRELWYETMVFECDGSGNITNWLELAGNRYTTRDEAVYGHAQMMQEWTNK